MSSPVDPRGRQLLKLKQAQRQMSLSSAQVQQQAAAAKRGEAAELRRAAELALDRAALQPESGLSRSALFDRLRVLAVGRAHALEAGHAAGELEATARACEAEEMSSRQVAALHHRKQKKLEHWNARRLTEVSRRRELRVHTQQLEEFVCRRRSTR